MSLAGRFTWGQRSVTVVMAAVMMLVGACGEVLAPRPAPLFFVSMEVRGEPIGSGFVDTGGEFEVLLREPFGLQIVDEIDILAFGGRERVQVTEAFVYSVGEVTAITPGAIVGLSACECNGVGFRFFRRAGKVLGLDFRTGEATLLDGVPPGGMVIPFDDPPPFLPGFDSSFIRVQVAGPDGTDTLTGLIDTGATSTVLRRGLVGSGSALSPDRMNVTIGSRRLGEVVLSVTLFDTDGLPDVILGTDIMRALAPEWYFDFTPGGQSLSMFPVEPPDSGIPTAVAATRRR